MAQRRNKSIGNKGAALLQLLPLLARYWQLSRQLSRLRVFLRF
jgi:hypothetical protein